jgi:hypothetical protein
MSTVNKISHPVLSQMRRSCITSDDDSIQTWRDIFGLEDPEASSSVRTDDE